MENAYQTYQIMDNFWTFPSPQTENFGEAHRQDTFFATVSTYISATVLDWCKLVSKTTGCTLSTLFPRSLSTTFGLAVFIGLLLLINRCIGSDFLDRFGTGLSIWCAATSPICLAFFSLCAYDEPHVRYFVKREQFPQNPLYHPASNVFFLFLCQVYGENVWFCVTIGLFFEFWVDAGFTYMS